MIGFIRKVGSAFLVLVLGLIVFTGETAVDEMGWTAKVREFVKAGPSAMFDASYEGTILALFWFLAGASIVSWGEWLFRKWEAHRKAKNWLHFTVEWQDGQPKIDKRVGVASLAMLDGTIKGSIYSSDPKVTRNSISIIVQFDCEMADPCPYVFADRGIIWRETDSGPYFTTLEIDLRTKENVTFSIVVRPLAWSDGYKGDAALKWHDATKVDRETILKPATVGLHPLRSLLSIAARTRH